MKQRLVGIDLPELHEPVSRSVDDAMNNPFGQEQGYNGFCIAERSSIVCIVNNVVLNLMCGDDVNSRLSVSRVDVLSKVDGSNE